MILLGQADYFMTLGLPRRFDLDTAQLEQRYFVLQRQYHPDRAGGNSAHEKQKLLQHSMDINQAYQVLKEPLSRARHLLAIQGIILGTDHDTLKPEPRLLAEVLEWRETLEGAATPYEIQGLYRTLFKEREACLEALEALFGEEAYEKAAHVALRLTYLDKLLDEIQRHHASRQGGTKA